jgi:hypothetical protein
MMGVMARPEVVSFAGIDRYHRRRRRGRRRRYRMVWLDSIYTVGKSSTAMTMVTMARLGDVPNGGDEQRSMTRVLV